MNAPHAAVAALADAEPAPIEWPVASASALEQLLGLPLSAAGAAGLPPIPLLRVAEGSTLFHEGAPARSVHLVQAGHFKVVRVGEDGYEQVLDFAGRHELLGCDGFADGHHRSAAVALEEAWVYAIPVAELLRLCHQLPGFGRRWQAAIGRLIARSGEIAWLMAAVGAEKRTARFVLLMAQRMATLGQSPRRLNLRMGRRDIASHLGLAHESVSRSFSLLAESGLLRVDNREIEILDRERLEAFARCTRGYGEPTPRRGGSAAPGAGPAAARSGAPH